MSAAYRKGSTSSTPASAAQTGYGNSSRSPQRGSISNEAAGPDYHRLGDGSEVKAVVSSGPQSPADQARSDQHSGGVRWGARAKLGTATDMKCRDSPCAVFFVIQVIVVLGLLIYYYVDCGGTDATFKKAIGRTQPEVAMLVAASFLCTLVLSNIYFLFISLFSKIVNAALFIHVLVVGGIIAWGVHYNLKATLGGAIPYLALVILYVVSARKSIRFTDAVLGASFLAFKRRCSSLCVSFGVSAVVVIYAYILLCVYVAFPELTYALFSGDPDEVKYSYYVGFYSHIYLASQVALALVHTVAATTAALWWWRHDDPQFNGYNDADLEDDWVVVVIRGGGVPKGTVASTSSGSSGSSSSSSSSSGRSSPDGSSKRRSSAQVDDAIEYSESAVASLRHQPAGAPRGRGTGVQSPINAAPAPSAGDDEEEDEDPSIERSGTTLREERLFNRDRMLEYVTGVAPPPHEAPAGAEGAAAGQHGASPSQRPERAVSRVSVAADPDAPPAKPRGLVWGMVKLSLTLHLGTVVCGAIFTLFIETLRMVFMTRHPSSVLGKVMLCLTRVTVLLMRLSNVYAFPYAILQNVTFFRSSRETVKALCVRNLVLAVQAHLAHFVIFTGLVFVNVGVAALSTYLMRRLFHVEDIRANTIEFSIIIITSLTVSLVILTPIYSGAVGSLLVWAIDPKSMRKLRPDQYDLLKLTKPLMPISEVDASRY